MLKSRLPQIAAQLEVVVEEALEEGAELVAERARQRLGPHRVTGRLEEAVHVAEDSDGVHVVAGGGVEDVFWGHFLEYGTSKNPPYPFLIPALDDERREVVALARAALRTL